MSKMGPNDASGVIWALGESFFFLSITLLIYHIDSVNGHFIVNDSHYLSHYGSGGGSGRSKHSRQEGRSSRA